MSIDVKESFVTDFAGIHQQHANMCNVYNSSIKMLLAVTSVPLLIGSVLLETSGGLPVLESTTLPLILTLALVLTPVAVLVVLAVIVHYRLVVLFYAKCLNRLRQIYLEQWNAARQGSSGGAIDLSPLPTNPSVPVLYEPFGPMGWIVHGTVFVNGLYLLLGLYDLGLRFPLLSREAAWPAAAGLSVLYCVALEYGYYLNASRWRIDHRAQSLTERGAGEEPGPDERAGAPRTEE